MFLVFWYFLFPNILKVFSCNSQKKKRFPNRNRGRWPHGPVLTVITVYSKDSSPYNEPFPCYSTSNYNKIQLSWWWHFDCSKTWRPNWPLIYIYVNDGDRCISNTYERTPVGLQSSWTRVTHRRLLHSYDGSVFRTRLPDVINTTAFENCSKPFWPISKKQSKSSGHNRKTNISDCMPVSHSCWTVVLVKTVVREHTSIVQ